MLTDRLPFQALHWQAPEGGPQSPRYQVGADGGGTHTRLRLYDANGHMLGQGDAGPSALGQGVEQAWLHLGQALHRAATQAGLPELGWSQCAVGLGLSGAGVVAQAQAFLAAAPRCQGLALDSDGITGVLGAHGGRPGAVIVAGTGSVGMSIDADGRRKAVGGWGWQYGDEGSGAWLGRGALRHAQRALDGREPGGRLAQAVWELAGSSTESLLAWSLGAQQQRLASLAPLVFEHEAHDETAARLVSAAVRELELLAAALDPEGRLPVALSGSVAQRLAPRLCAPLQARCVPPQGDAIDGALLLLQRALETP